MMESLTPMHRQYNEIKSKYTDCILFFRLGDFYEMFGDDAVKASKILGIILTRRNKGAVSEIPMCGIPHHAAENYIDKLTNEGLKVAICEQVSDPALPGIVKREVVRVITPATSLSENLNNYNINNYLVTIFKNDKKFSLGCCDLSTGELKITEDSDLSKIVDETRRISPNEIICSEENFAFLESVFANDQCFIYKFQTFRNFREVILEVYEDHNLESLGLNSDVLLIETLGFLLSYLIETQKSALIHLKHPKLYYLNDFMHIDYATLRNLEIVKSFENEERFTLFHTINQTVSPAGKRKLRDWISKPLLKESLLEERLASVQELYDNYDVIMKLRDYLSNIHDIEKLLAKISLRKVVPQDLLKLSTSLVIIDKIRKEISNKFKYNYLSKLIKGLDPLSFLSGIIRKAIKDEPSKTFEDGENINLGYSDELDKFLIAINDSKSIIANIQSREQKRTKNEKLKVRYNKIFGYYIEVSKAKSENIPEDYIRIQTLVNSERYKIPDLQELEQTILEAEEKCRQLERSIIDDIIYRIIKEIKTLQLNANNLAILDVFQSFAYQAHKNKYVKPIILSDKNCLEIVEGRHPVVESINNLGQFIPNSIELGDFKTNGKCFVKLLTGPNMSGKSTYLRQVALIVLLAQIGSFVPAKKLNFSLVDCIFTRVGASDNLAKGQSTFMVEMQESAYILNNATRKSLVILDEIGRGTSTHDGVSIAWSILEYIHDKIKAKTLFATHYHELIDVANNLPYASNISIDVKEAKTKVVFLYNVKEGAIDRSYGIEVAKIAGIPKEIIFRSKRILKFLETSAHKSNMDRQNLKQFNLFEDTDVKFLQDDYATNEIVTEIQAINVNELTPLDALNKISELKNKYKDKL